MNAQPRSALIVKKNNFTNRLRLISLFDPKIRLCFDSQSVPMDVLCYLESIWILGIRYITSSFLFRKYFHFFPGVMLKILSSGTFEVLKVLSKPVVSKEIAIDK